ncbi:MAG: hypothetical protein V4731_11295 [Pseudomonadota bacterium]
MNIHQVCVTFVPEQDRFLLRIRAQAGEELRFWLTRRLTLPLLPALKKVATEQIEHQQGGETAGPLEVQREKLMESFRKESEAYGGDFNTPYEDKGVNHPLGAEPLLVTEIKLTLMPSGQLKLKLIEKLQDRTRDVQVMMAAQLTQGLLHLLNHGLGTSGWTTPETATVSSVPTEDDGALLNALEERPKYLN